MKLAILFLATQFFSANAFSTPFAVRQNVATASTSSLNMIENRRDFLQSASIIATTGVVASTVVPGAAFAKDFVAKFDDVKVILALGVSLDKLAVKCADPDQFESALEGLRAFNKDPNFYPGYARNFISKTIKNNADGDSRVGYVRQASVGISSIQELLEGRQGLSGKEAADEAVKRVRKAQSLLAKFFAEAGVEDERIASFVAAHP